MQASSGHTGEELRHEVHKSNRRLKVVVGGLLAVILAWNVTPVAANHLRVRSSDIVRGAVTTPKLHRGAVTNRTVANNTLTGAKLNRNTLTGREIKEPTLGQVPSAANAGKVDGFDADALTRVARMDTLEQLPFTTTERTYGVPLSINAPRVGFVMIHGSITVRNEFCTAFCAVSSRVRHIQSNTYSVDAGVSIAGQGLGNVSHAWVFPVNAGVNSFDVRIRRFPGDGTLLGWSGELAAIYSPFGPTGTRSIGTTAEVAEPSRPRSAPSRTRRAR